MTITNGKRVPGNKAAEVRRARERVVRALETFILAANEIHDLAFDTGYDMELFSMSQGLSAAWQAAREAVGMKFVDGGGYVLSPIRPAKVIRLECVRDHLDELAGAL